MTVHELTDKIAIISTAISIYDYTTDALKFVGTAEDLQYPKRTRLTLTETQLQELLHLEVLYFFILDNEMIINTIRKED